MDMDIVT